MFPRSLRAHIRALLVAFGAAVLVASSLGLLFQAGTALADNVSWVGLDGNVYRAAPDGTRKQQLTTDGTAEAGYMTPSQKNDGTVVAIRKDSSSAFAYFIRPSDRKVVDSWILPKTGAGSFVPFNGGTISPSGGMFVYDWHYFDCWTNPCQLNQRVSFIAGPGTTDPCLINCHTNYVRPRWIPGTPYAGFVDTQFNRVWVQKANSAQPIAWLGFNDPNAGDMESFDVSTNGKVVLEVTPEGSNDSEFTFWNTNGTPPAGSPTHRCSAINVAKAPAYPRFSPDGSKITWQDRGSVYVANVPATNTPDANCSLNPVKIGAGKEPAWGLATIPADDPDPDPNDPNDPDPNDPDPNQPASIKSVAAAPVLVKVKAGRTATVKVKVAVSGSRANEIRVCPSVGKRQGRLVELPACRLLPGIDAGTSRTETLKVRTMKQARGSVPVKLTASGPGLAARSTTATLKVYR